MEQEKAPFQNLRPVETRRASEVIYEQIRDIIISGEMQPGDRLPSERNMMELMQRSRPTIREALRMLERDGFIRTVAGSQGAVVQELSTKTVEQSLEALLQTSSITLDQLAEMRSVTEIATARWAAQRCTPQDMNRLEELLKQEEACVSDYEQFTHLDPKFHAALGKAAHNDVAIIITKVFSRMVENLLNERMHSATEKQRITMCKKIISMHKSVVEAIRAKDPDEAVQSMRLHVDAFHEDLEI
ncbi:MAG: FadR/GntR family transcriptional regulator [Oscillospiraceae bacterium]|nr:FadR/GntR family transcriptional regulator [Oscillospiraceae bacterium]